MSSKKGRPPNKGSFGRGRESYIQPVDPSILDRTLELVQEGNTLAETARVLGRSRRTVQRYVATLREQGRIGYLREQALPLTDEQLSHALTLLKDGSGYNEAARTIGCSNKTLAKHLPGFALTRVEVLERAWMGLAMASIPDHL